MFQKRVNNTVRQNSQPLSHPSPATRKEFGRQMDDSVRRARPIGVDVTSLPEGGDAAVTFDDGLDVVENALPELRCPS